MNNTTSELKKILKKVFTTAQIPSNIKNLKIYDIPEWDSLGNFNLLLEIEKHYKIRFSEVEISEITSIKKILEKLAK